MDKPPVTKQPAPTMEDTKDCISSVFMLLYTLANLLVCGFGAVLIYQNWEQVWKDPILGFLAVIFAYLFTRDMSLR